MEPRSPAGFLKEPFFEPGSKALNQLALGTEHSPVDLGVAPGLRPDYSGVTDQAVCSFKGGDPAAPSGTATLLRLRPSHQTRPRRLPPLRVSSATSIVLGFHDVTGGVYKARERIHRSVLTCGY